MISTTSDPDKHRDRRGALLAAAGVIVLLGGLYVAGHFLLGNRLPVGTRIAGVKVGSMPVEQARAKVAEELRPRLHKPVRLVYGEHTFTVDPERAGLTFDLDQTMRDAGGGRTWNPVVMVRTIVGRGDVAPALEVDQQSLQRAVDRIARVLDDPAVEPRITFANGEPKVRQPHKGRVVNRAATSRLIQRSYLVDTDAGVVPTRVDKPSVQRPAVRKALSTYARPAVSGPVRLKVAKGSVSLRVRDFAPSLVMRVRRGELVPMIRTKTFRRPLHHATRPLRRPAEDATVRVVDGRPELVPGRAGVAVDAAQVAKALTPVLAKKGDHRVVRVTPRKTRPDVRLADARRLRITRRVGSFVVHYPHSRSRNVNERRAAGRIDQTVLEPGETFSLNASLGRRSRARGFVPGKVATPGGSRVVPGAGVSQVATAVYNAALLAGVDIVEHAPHRVHLGRFPVGRDARIGWPSPDLSFKNDTGHGVLVHAWVRTSTPRRRGALHVELWGARVGTVTVRVSGRRDQQEPAVRYDTSRRCAARSGRAGFSVELHRRVVRDGTVRKDETTRVRYDPVDAVRCHAKHARRHRRGR